MMLCVVRECFVQVQALDVEFQSQASYDFGGASAGDQTPPTAWAVYNNSDDSLAAVRAADSIPVYLRGMVRVPLVGFSDLVLA